MKVWMFSHGGEGMPTYTHLFNENNPPSIERMRELYVEWGEEYNLEDKLKQLRETGVYNGCYEGSALTLEEVEG